MRLIFDEDLPRDLLPHFESGKDEVTHVEDLGWKGIRNSELLSRISGESLLRTDYERALTLDLSGSVRTSEGRRL